MANRYQRALCSPARSNERFDRAVRLTGCEQRRCERKAGSSRSDAFVEPASKIDTLYRSAESKLEIAGFDRCKRPVEESPHETLDVAREASTLDRAIEQLGALGKLATQSPDPAEAMEQDGTTSPWPVDLAIDKAR